MIMILKIGCDWCGTTGWITEDHRCGKCGRSDDLAYEQRVAGFVRNNESKFVDWHSYDGHYERRLKERMERRAGSLE